MVYSAKSDDVETISQFTRIKYIKITTTGTSTPANYQVKLIIAYEPEMNADFSDIRFNTVGHGYIDYWIESKTDSITATVWVELPDAISDPGSDTIWMYYGNSGLSNGGIGADTFLQYHATASANFVDARIVSPPNVIFESKLRVTAATHTVGWGLSEESGGNPFEAGIDSSKFESYNVLNGRNIIARDETGVASSNEAPSLTSGTWYKVRMVLLAASLKCYVDGNEIGTGVTTHLSDDTLGLAMRIWAGTGEQEWSFARKYIANEPTPSYGTSQHQRRTPQFIG